MSWWLMSNSGKLRYDDPVVTTANGGLGQLWPGTPWKTWLRLPQALNASLAFQVWFSMTFKSSNQITRLIIFYGLIIV